MLKRLMTETNKGTSLTVQTSPRANSTHAQF